MAEPRYYISKPSGSQFARVIDRESNKQMHRFDIFKNYYGNDGWKAAERCCERLNKADAARAATSGSEGEGR